jgi:hypothetical protein
MAAAGFGCPFAIANAVAIRLKSKPLAVGKILKLVMAETSLSFGHDEGDQSGAALPASVFFACQAIARREAR